MFERFDQFFIGREANCHITLDLWVHRRLGSNLAWRRDGARVPGMGHSDSDYGIDSEQETTRTRGSVRSLRNILVTLR